MNTTTQTWQTTKPTTNRSRHEAAQRRKAEKEARAATRLGELEKALRDRERAAAQDLRARAYASMAARWEQRKAETSARVKAQAEARQATEEARRRERTEQTRKEMRQTPQAQGARRLLTSIKLRDWKRETDRPQRVTVISYETGEIRTYHTLDIRESKGVSNLDWEAHGQEAAFYMIEQGYTGSDEVTEYTLIMTTATRGYYG